MHFFNPVKRMPLVEVIRGKKTSPDAVAACAGLALHLGKTPVVVADVAGFLVNRILGPYLDESLRMFAGGVDPGHIDRALEAFGMPMGPLALLDEVGFDIATHAAASLHQAYGERMSPCDVLEPMIQAGHLGKKSGRGFYVHELKKSGRERGSRKAKSAIASDLARFVPSGAPRVPSITDDEIADRAVMAMLNEAVRALEEEVAASPREIDLATVFGMGFPPFRGGILRFADSLGVHAVVEKMEKIVAAPDVAARPGGRERFFPADSLSAMAKNLRRFHA
jgi:3-hydroxyacyl-CoA dehydrogenase